VSVSASAAEPNAAAPAYSPYEEQSIASALTRHGVELDSDPEGKVIEEIVVEVLDARLPAASSNAGALESDDGSGDSSGTSAPSDSSSECEEEEVEADEAEEADAVAACVRGATSVNTGTR
jgi:hypothetical protein